MTTTMTTCNNLRPLIITTAVQIQSLILLRGGTLVLQQLIHTTVIAVPVIHTVP